MSSTITSAPTPFVIGGRRAVTPLCLLFLFDFSFSGSGLPFAHGRSRPPTPARALHPDSSMGTDEEVRLGAGLLGLCLGALAFYSTVLVLATPEDLGGWGIPVIKLVRFFLAVKRVLGREANDLPETNPLQKETKKLVPPRPIKSGEASPEMVYSYGAAPSAATAPRLAPSPLLEQDRPSSLSTPSPAYWS
ncbi:hypothetical protein DFH08DRAFT_965439 [Mycena albidolilacea]|uniref:Uncharacterized protein n=1 Tax=Mycena albidolilacea TaxID=1033008 RepID=A0AAD7EM42_9AGAR|nr:hypothetical protein DFH08DRAFT_965439 [Mycena albidolilacea]